MERLTRLFVCLYVLVVDCDNVPDIRYVLAAAQTATSTDNTPVSADVLSQAIIHSALALRLVRFFVALAREESVMFNFNEGLSNKRSGGFVQKAATVLAVAISGLASFQFFSSYSGALLAGLVPTEFLSIAAGLIGVFMLEGGTLLLATTASSRTQTVSNS